MRKACGMFLGMCLVLTFAAASMAAETEPVRQTATAVAELDGEQALVTVDITGGWSVEFSTGAVYLFDGENDGMKEAVAYGYLIDQAEYDENVEEYKDYESFTELENGVTFSEDEGGSNKYLFEIGDGLYYMVAADPDADADDIFSRFTATPGVIWEMADAEDTQWPRDDYFMDENGNMLSITWMDDIDEPGWYVGCLLGEDYIEDSWGGTLALEGDVLQGSLLPSGSQDELNVTVSEEGTDGVILTVDGGETYHLTSLGDSMDASIFVTVSTEGWGAIAYAEGEETPEYDEEYPFQSAQINLAGPETYTIGAWPEAGNVFVKWTKDGEDFSTDPMITVLLDESAEFTAVFEEDPGWQNPVMNFVGEYQSGRAHALVECFGNTDAWITIEWGGSASELARWDIVGYLDMETLTIEYEGGTKSIVVYDENGDIVSQEPEYQDGTGTITFNDDGTFTWHEDQSVYGEDMVFEWAPAASE